MKILLTFLIFPLGLYASDLSWKKLKSKPVTPTEQIPYSPEKGDVYVVNSDHKIPGDMIVQGDRVLLSLDAKAIEGFSKSDLKVTWKLATAMGDAKLDPSADNKLQSTFHADKFGENVVTVTASDAKQSKDFQIKLKCHFSTDIMLTHDFAGVKVPTNQPNNPYLAKPLDKQVGHRENFLVKNEETGRIHSFWWAKINHPKSGYIGARWAGLASIVSDDLGLTWHSPRFVVLQDKWRTGWATGVWQKSDKSSKGEIFIMTGSNVGNSANSILSLRSSDDGESWKFEKDLSETFKKELKLKNLRSTYFGGNRTIKTAKGTLVAPVVFNQFATAMWSDDNGKTWNGSNMDKSFPQGNEDALIETIGGEKLVFMCRAKSGKGSRKQFGIPYYRSESTDGGKTWVSKGASKLAASGVNLGMNVINDPRIDIHGFGLHTTAAKFNGRHNRHSMTVSINDDIKGLADEKWDTRLLMDYRTNYTDIVYQKEDQSLLLTVETWYWGKKYEGHHAWGDTPIIRTFKFSPAYLKALPKYQ